MKQTKNALSMLLSAYRSVFKSAYFKGMATAVVLTAGLSAGAQAAVTLDDQVKADATTPVQVTGTTDNTVILNGEIKWANGGLYLADESAMTVSGHGTLGVNGNMTLNNAALTLDGTGDQTLQLVGSDHFVSETDATIKNSFSATNSDITLKKQNSSMGFATVTVNGGNISLEGNGSNIYAYGTGYDYQTDDAGTNEDALNDADMTLSGVESIKMANNTTLGAMDGMSISDSKLEVSGLGTIVGAAKGDAAGVKVSATEVNLTGAEAMLYISAKQGNGTIALNNVTVGGDAGVVLAKGDTHVTGNLVLNGANSEGSHVILHGGKISDGDPSINAYNNNKGKFTFEYDLTSDNATIEVNDASVGYANIDLQGGSLVLAGKEGSETANVWAYGAGQNLNFSETVNQVNLNLSGTNLSMKGYADLGSRMDLSINGGFVEASGTNNTILSAYNAQGTLSVSNASVNVVKYGSLELKGHVIDADSVFDVAECAILTFTANEAETGKADLTGSTFTNNGTIKVSGDLIVDLVSTMYSAEGSSLELSGDLTVNGKDAVDLTTTAFTNKGADTTLLKADASTVKVDTNYDSMFDSISAELIQTADAASFEVKANTSITSLNGIEFLPAADGVATQVDGNKVIEVKGTYVQGGEGAVGGTLAQDFNISGEDGALTFAGGDWQVGDITVANDAVGKGLIINEGDVTANSVMVGANDSG